MIKVSSFHSDLHRQDVLAQRHAAFLASIETYLGEQITVSPIDDYEADLKLVFISSGGSEGKFLEHFNELRPPYYLLTSGTDNSLAASIEILTYLNCEGYEGEILHGNPKYIAERIKDLIAGNRRKTEEGESSVRDITGTAEIGGRYGVVGEPSDWLIASVPDEDKVKEVFGTELVSIPMEDLLEEYDATESDPDERNGLDFGSSNRLVRAVLRLREKNNLDGLTIRCFDLLSSIHTTGCLSLAQLNADGFIGTCEGDVMSMLTMALIRKVTGQSSFQANPSRIDVDDNTMVLAHCTMPYDMAQSFGYNTHFESGIGVAIKGEFKTEPVTILRLSKDLDSYWIAEGRIIGNLNESTLCRTQIEVKLDDSYSVGDLLRVPCGNHHIVFYGRHRDEIVDFLS
ncbi:MAG: hypothetical protein IKX15_00765 [Spirochaetales bacterium]|nr:hypothetical protein [Spirochaetales bacterium]